jgi:hypothetical protein
MSDNSRRELRNFGIFGIFGSPHLFLYYVDILVRIPFKFTFRFFNADFWYGTVYIKQWRALIRDVGRNRVSSRNQAPNTSKSHMLVLGEGGPDAGAGSVTLKLSRSLCVPQKRARAVSAQQEWKQQALFFFIIFCYNSCIVAGSRRADIALGF